ncbi:MAG TPA: MFS transporter [Aliidongia sp.]|uniref:MFS transporter n=1 Tax=Aliidongia sp. TaxID=1914230 RepID=UPI002DDCC4C0|nr:MFS transporter [Aliidongia sp.]HEV2676487.1 MFS transporter [Aliidongia sp.]
MPDAMPEKPLTRGAVLVMAGACGFGVANIYYNQPMLADMAADLRDPAVAGIVPTVTQVGYALGLLLLAPLGDRFDRKRLILIELAGLVAALGVAAIAPNLAVLALASLAVGVLTTLVQQIVPMAAHLASAERRGQVVGTVMSGLLIGILGGRVLSGAVAQHLGWREMFVIAAGLMIVLFIVLVGLLPRTAPTSTLSYPALMRSLWRLFRCEPVLREASAVGALLFAGFSAFWATLTLYLASPAYHLGAQAAGLFGLVGIAGALAAPLAGRLADRGGPRRTVGFAILVTLLSFAVFAFAGRWLAGLVAGVLLLDLGVQGAQVSNQSRIYALQPESRSRINTVYMVIYFAGGSAGSALGALAWSYGGWLAVSALGAGFTGLALLIHVFSRRETMARAAA